MTAKIQAILSLVLLLLALTLNQCEAKVVRGVDFTSVQVDATTIASTIDHSNVANGRKAVITRRLKQPHVRKEEPFFYVLLATLIVAVVTLASLLSLIPVLMRARWSCFKSAFWVAHRHVVKPSESARDFFQMGTTGESVRYNAANPGTDRQSIEAAATLLTDIFVPSFASGAILATVLFLIVPESILLIQRGTSSYNGEIEIVSGTVARFGVALMVGFCLPLMLGAFFPRSSEYSQPPECAKPDEKEQLSNKPEVIEEGDEDKEDDESEGSKDEFALNGSNTDDPNKFDLSSIQVQPKPECLSLAQCILIGDALNNFLDGIFIGAAYMTCSTAAAVCVTMVTIYSEISQQMADYFLLTNCAMISIPRSLLLIFASGLAVVVGSLVILASKPGELAVGVFLAIASGVYLHTSASECLPRLYLVVESTRDRMWALVFFITGAIPIGFCLLSKRTCDA